MTSPGSNARTAGGTGALPDLRSLDLLCQVVVLGSVSRAAAECGMSQPSATARLRRLERALGITLLEHGPTGSRPTRDGTSIAAAAAPLLVDARKVADLAIAIRTGKADAMRIAASFTIAEHLMAGWLGRLPTGEAVGAIELDVVNSAEVLVRVRDQRATLGFIESPADVGSLLSQVVGGDELVCVVGLGHPWVRRRGPVSGKVLASTPLIMRERGSGTRDFLAAAFRAAGLGEPVARMELGSTEAVKAAVAGGSGPAVISRLAVSESRGLHVVSVAGLDLTRRFRAVWLPNRAMDQRIRALLDAAARMA